MCEVLILIVFLSFLLLGSTCYNQQVRIKELEEENENLRATLKKFISRSLGIGDDL